MFHELNAHEFSIQIVDFKRCSEPTKNNQSHQLPRTRLLLPIYIFTKTRWALHNDNWHWGSSWKEKKLMYDINHLKHRWIFFIIRLLFLFFSKNFCFWGASGLSASNCCNPLRKTCNLISQWQNWRKRTSRRSPAMLLCVILGGSSKRCCFS